MEKKTCTGERYEVRNARSQLMCEFEEREGAGVVLHMANGEITFEELQRKVFASKKYRAKKRAVNIKRLPHQ